MLQHQLIMPLRMLQPNRVPCTFKNLQPCTQHLCQVNGGLGLNEDTVLISCDDQDGEGGEFLEVAETLSGQTVCESRPLLGCATNRVLETRCRETFNEEL
jgi:hypothetical protein